MLDACGQPREPPDLFVIARHFDVIAERLCTGGEGSDDTLVHLHRSSFLVLYTIQPLRRTPSQHARITPPAARIPTGGALRHLSRSIAERQLNNSP